MRAHSGWTVEEVRRLGLHTDVVTAAQILGIGRTTAYELIRRGEFPIPALRLGTRIRIPIEPLIKYLCGDP